MVNRFLGVLFREIRLRFWPPRIQDPDFGSLIFMYIPNDPKKSYWEAMWTFPPVNNQIAIGLGGDEQGPARESRKFYLSMIERYPSILEVVRAPLTDQLRQWWNQELPEDVFEVVKLSGIQLESDPTVDPVSWEIAFETIRGKWLGIVVPFVGDVPQTPTIDT